MINPLQTKLAIRSAAIILLLITILSGVILTASALLLTQRENANQQARLQELTTTVENTAEIAVFLEDAQLANEIAQGLMTNQTVGGVVIFSGDKVLASQGNVTPNTEGDVEQDPYAITHQLYSPFQAGEKLGELVVTSNQEMVEKNVADVVLFNSLIQVLQGLAVAAGIILVVMRLITRPITVISNRLHKLNVALGEKLPPPNSPQTDEIGRLVLDVNSMIDNLVRLLNSEKALREEKELSESKFRNIFEKAASAILLINRKGEVLSSNPAFKRLFHLNQNGQHTVNIFDLVGDDREQLRVKVDQCLDEHTNKELEIRTGKTQDNWLELLINPGGESTVQIIANEITGLKKAHTDAMSKASTDPLCGVGNRLGFDARLKELVPGAEVDDDTRHTLIFIDLDDFKQVNDIHGHHAGDAVLIQVTEILKSLVRKSDYIARLGGDEFVVILQDVHELHIVKKFASNLLAAFEQPIAISPTLQVSIGASIGIAFSYLGVSPDELVKRADTAMYQAKNSGKNTYSIYTESQDS